MLGLFTIMQVALGGAAGSVLRHLTNVGAARAFGTDFPLGTMAVNVLGSFLMGVLAVLILQHGLARLSPLVLTGFLGGFTTFSSFSLDTLFLWERGAQGAAIGYAGLTVALSLGAIVLGLWLARGLWA